MLWIFLCLSVSWAEQQSYAVKKGQLRWYFEVSWQGNGDSQQTSYSLPTSAILEDLQISGPR